ncbi:hypothetical protein O181_016445 [Austropuccinia psidii MF-1]|uniref:Uncharacterized protein n=1 Tax=Austropuccinia psidii MF-1 TaxID=1389203 RepID=A0A9Q3C5U6_9BASI|nr:hypothetical protein [Austropuccinia psidii MF-1]
MEYIDVKKENDTFSRRMEEKQPSTTKTRAKTNLSGQKKKFQCEEESTSQKKGKGKARAIEAYNQGNRILNIQQDAMENVFQMARAMMEIKKRYESSFKSQK